MTLPASPPRTLVDALERLPSGDERGFRFLGREGEERYFPYAELRREASRRAGLLTSRGLKKGDRLAIVVPDPAEFVLSFLGAVVAGVVPVPIFPRASFKGVETYVESLRHILEASRARSLLCMEQNLPVVETLGSDELELLTTELLFAPAVTARERFVAPEIAPGDLCFLQFTSGSTSRPKGVMVRHENLVANATSFLGPHGLDRRDDDVGVSWLPLFHDMGLIGFVLGTLVCDIPVVILPTESFARSPKRWLETISRYGGTITYAPNFAYELVTRRLKDADLSSLDLSRLRVAGCGAEPVRARTLEAFAEKLAPTGFRPEALLPSYGMAEATLAITFHGLERTIRVDRVDRDALARGEATPASVGDETAVELVGNGVCFPKHEVRIVNDSGQTLEERQVGEVITRGPSVTPGYFENAEATKASFRGGFLHTGDLGYVADGELFICGRAKDLIIIRGANFHPQDLEWPLGELPGVRRGNVVAFSIDDGDGERLGVLAECGRADAAALREAIPRTLTERFGLTPSMVGLLPAGSLPKTSSGKARRLEARRMYQAGEFPLHA